MSRLQTLQRQTETAAPHAANFRESNLPICVVRSECKQNRAAKKKIRKTKTKPRPKLMWAAQRRLSQMENKKKPRQDWQICHNATTSAAAFPTAATAAEWIFHLWQCLRNLTGKTTICLALFRDLPHEANANGSSFIGANYCCSRMRQARRETRPVLKPLPRLRLTNQAKPSQATLLAWLKALLNGQRFAWMLWYKSAIYSPFSGHRIRHRLSKYRTGK